MQRRETRVERESFTADEVFDVRWYVPSDADKDSDDDERDDAEAGEGTQGAGSSDL